MSDKSSYQLFAERMLQKNSKLIPEILRCMINDNQADLLVSLPGTSEETLPVSLKINASGAASVP